MRIMGGAMVGKLCQDRGGGDGWQTVRIMGGGDGGRTLLG